METKEIQNTSMETKEIQNTSMETKEIQNTINVVDGQMIKSLVMDVNSDDVFVNDGVILIDTENTKYVALDYKTLTELIEKVTP